MTDARMPAQLTVQVNKSGKVFKINTYTVLEKMGEGTEGIVCKVMKNQDPNNIKVVKIKKDTFTQGVQGVQGVSSCSR